MDPLVPPHAGLIDAGDLVIDGIVRVVTESSVWIITPEAYRGCPKTEGARGQTPGIDGRLDDLVEHPHRGRRWWRDPSACALRLQLLPVAGLTTGLGIITGLVVAATGALNPPAALGDQR
jgi:hypothetical protein